MALKPISTVERLLHSLTGWRFWKVPTSDPVPATFKWEGMFAYQPIPTGAVGKEIFTDPIYDGAKDISFAWGSSVYKPYKGSLIGAPYEVLSSASSMRTVMVVDHDRGVWYEHMPVNREPWIQHYPNPHGDQHYLMVDPHQGLIYEAINFRPAVGGAPYAASHVVVWDTSRSFDEQAGPGIGVCAAKIPYFPLVTRYDEVASGKVNHAAGLSMSNYMPGKVWPAQNHDGAGFGYQEPPVPVFAGQRLRLKEAYYKKMLALGGAAATHATQLRNYGGFVMDKSGRHSGSILKAPDARWANTNITKFAPLITDFEIVS